MTDRYSRQILFAGIGPEGQRRLRNSRVVIIGCGALGSAQAEGFARAGVGNLRLVDRDFVEFSNLQRQTMFTEADAAERLPKTVACANHIREINSDVEVEAEVVDVRHSNIEQLIQGCDLVLDGTDNFATRYLINDACVKNSVSWIYGAAVGSYGVSMTIRPGLTPCLRCIFPEPPPAAGAPTCDTAGVIMPIISVVSAMQITEALKILTGDLESLHNSLMQIDVWRNEWRSISVGKPSADCLTCGLRGFEFLNADGNESAAVLCGRHAVQISPAQNSTIDLAALTQKLRAVGEVRANDYLVRFNTGDYELTVFRDARSIISGTDDIAIARSLYARYIGT
jgi:molybdopterin/thiamine biosynthesis adenylyltransferase